MNTIVAISTAPGIGGIGIIRMSGEDTYKILKKIFKSKKNIEIDQIKGYTIKYGYIIEDKQMVDEVLVSFFKNPNSYTREDLCEIHSHGGIYIIRKILELCLKNGAILAEPGEFTKRAFLNGRLDLSQAEAVIDMINSKTEKEAKASIHQLEGSLSKSIREIREELMSIMVDVEVSIDYPEYDVEEVSHQRAFITLNKIKEKLLKLEKSFENGKIIKDGVKVTLIGKPNAGKSSLLNAILKEDRAIVTDIEGTTRDIIEESISIKGIPINLIDTAGIRQAEDIIEKIGIEKSRKRAEEADLVIAIFDVSKELNQEDYQILELINNKKSIVVLNKMDIQINQNTIHEMEKYRKEKDIIYISAKKEEGLEKIYDKIEEMFHLNEIEVDHNELITNVRHKDIIHQAIESTNQAIQIVEEKMPIDMIGIYIKNIMENLGEITGETVSDEVIKEIFSKFCLGK